jgi:hypothetical protein
MYFKGISDVVRENGGQRAGIEQHAGVVCGGECVLETLTYDVQVGGELCFELLRILDRDSEGHRCDILPGRDCRSQPTKYAFVFPIPRDLYKIPRRDRKRRTNQFVRRVLSKVFESPLTVASRGTDS